MLSITSAIERLSNTPVVRARTDLRTGTRRAHLMFVPRKLALLLALLVPGGLIALACAGLVAVLDLIGRSVGTGDGLITPAGAAILHPLVGDCVVGLTCGRRCREG